MDRVTFAQYTKRLDKLVRRIIGYEGIEADYLMWSQHKCFDAQGHAQFHAAYLQYRDILIPEAKLEYEELHDPFMMMFGVKAKR
jgi:hypothetical protein